MKARATAKRLPRVFTLQRYMIGVTLRAWCDPAEPHRETFVALPNEKAACVALEARGLVAIRKTEKLFGGYHEWWVRLTVEGAALCKAEREQFGLTAAERAVLEAA